jgi:hypothetical protein
MERGVLEYVALGMLVFVCLFLFYAIIAIHDIPYVIAKKRNHPHQEAIHYAGWVSMFTLHAIWPFLWIWATLYRAGAGYGFGAAATNNREILERLDSFEERLGALGGKNLELATSAIDKPTLPAGEERASASNRPEE